MSSWRCAATWASSFFKRSSSDFSTGSLLGFEHGKDRAGGGWCAIHKRTARAEKLRSIYEFIGDLLGALSIFGLLYIGLWAVEVLQ